MSDHEDEELLQLALEELAPDSPKRFPSDFVKDVSGSDEFTEIEVPGTPLLLVPSSQSLVASPRGSFRYKAKNRPQAKYIIYSHEIGQENVRIPKDNLTVFKAVTAYERYLDQMERRCFEFFLGRTFDETRAKRLTEEILRKLGIRKLRERESKEGSSEAVISSHVNGFPPDPSFWFGLAAWAKENNQLLSSERKMAYNVGRYLRNGWPLSSRQKTWAEKILETAKSLGFNL